MRTCIFAAHTGPSGAKLGGVTKANSLLGSSAAPTADPIPTLDRRRSAVLIAPSQVAPLRKYRSYGLSSPSVSPGAVAASWRSTHTAYALQVTNPLTDWRSKTTMGMNPLDDQAPSDTMSEGKASDHALAPLLALSAIEATAAPQCYRLGLNRTLTQEPEYGLGQPLASVTHDRLLVGVCPGLDHGEGRPVPGSRSPDSGDILVQQGPTRTMELGRVGPAAC
jgi:hypothetical protein